MAKGNKTKRDLILESAYELFQQRGYYDTKIIDIADAAGIGKGTVYEYFESKDAIFLELFKTKVAGGYEHLSELSVKKISCADKIKAYIDLEFANSSTYAFNKNFLVDLMLKSDALKNPQLIAAIQKLVSEKFSFIYQVINEGITGGEFRQTDPFLATISIMGAINFYIGLKCSPFNPAEFLPEEVFNSMYEHMNREEFIRLITDGLVTAN